MIKGYRISEVRYNTHHTSFNVYQIDEHKETMLYSFYTEAEARNFISKKTFSPSNITVAIFDENGVEQ